MAQLQARRATALLALLTIGISGCAEAPTDPAQVSTVPSAPIHHLTSQLFQSGASVTAWDPIAETVQPANFQAAYCTATPKYGVGADWRNPHNAYVLGGHPWAYDAFYAPWINAWNYLGSSGGNPVSPNYNWTKYETQVSGTGSFVIHLMADNCSWIYLDGILVGVQGDTRSTTAYGLTLNGAHTLTFVIFDGGGLAGGKFLLETTTNPPPPLNNDLDADGHVNDQDAFPLDPSEWADSDGDGVGDNADAYDHSNTGSTIVVVGCNSGAPNWRVEGGTWANDLVAAAYASAGNHGQFVSAVASLADGWKKAGRITGREQGAIVSCAARTK